MTVALVFPPVVDPRAPHLALPSLAAHLRSENIEVRMFDLNIAGVRFLLKPERLQQAAADLRRAQKGQWDMSTAQSKLALYANNIAANIDWALDTLSDPEQFFNANASNSARELVSSGLALSAAAKHPGLSYEIMPPRYDVDGVDPALLTDLINICSQEELNLFAEHWHSEFLPDLANLQPELVGITITNRQQIIPGLMLAKLLRGLGYFTVIGGTVYTKFAQELSRLPAFFEHFADAVIVYEGESAMLNLLRELRGKRQFSRVPNLLFLTDGQVVATDTHIEDINSLLTPDFDGLDVTAYLAPHLVLPILTGKGCYFNRCKFCDIPFINHISRKAYRVRTVAKIATDIISLADRFGCRHFLITDEALSPRLLVKLANELKKFSYKNLSFTGYARLEAGFTPEVCAILRDMGLKKLYFGLESADQATQDHMDKGTDVTVAPIVLQNCADAGINFHLFSIIGFPQESESSARTTLQFFIEHQDLIDHPGNSFDIHPFGLDLRTDYFDDSDQYGIEIAPKATQKEFVINIDRSQWSNPSSLDAGQVEHLLKDEFYPQLRETYRRFHATAEPLWPGFEEYAVLYGDYYAGRIFPYMTSIPALAKGEQLELDWSRSVAVMQHEDSVLLLQRHTFLRVAKVVYDMLKCRRVGDVDTELADDLATMVNRPTDVTNYLNSLVLHGFLRVTIVHGAELASISASATTLA